jgi:hypothetical protein
VFTDINFQDYYSLVGLWCYQLRVTTFGQKTNYAGVEPQIDLQGGSKRNRGISYLLSDQTEVPAPHSYAMSENIGF